MTTTDAQPLAIDREATIKKILSALSGYDLSVLQKDRIITDLLETQTPIPTAGEVEWGYRSADGVIGPFPRAPRPSAGYTIVRRTIGPWIEVQK